MKGYAPQGIIDAAALLLASHIASGDWSQEQIDQFLASSARDYRRDYRDDNTFEDDVRKSAYYANEVADTTYSERATRADFLRYCYTLVRDFEPNGSRRKKFWASSVVHALVDRTLTPQTERSFSRLIALDTWRWHI